MQIYSHHQHHIITALNVCCNSFPQHTCKHKRERDREDVKMSYIKNNFQHKVIKHLKARYM